MATNDRVLVVGGTRGTGLLIAQLLLKRGQRVRVLARDPVAAATRLDPAIEVIAGDITRPETLTAAVDNVDQIVFTAGARSGRYAPESLVKATDYEGVLNTLAAAQLKRFKGRFLYMNSIGITTPSLGAMLINLLKRNTLVWRRRAEEEIRASGVDYTIIRVGFLSNAPANQRQIDVSQGALPLSLNRRTGRADVAEAFAAALHHPNASRATFEIIWGKGHQRENWDQLLDGLKPDAEAAGTLNG
ncbi:NAD(P)H-binding protein [Mesorhizobium sp. ZC-5]|uniref:NAD(P)H-binding protein n=1 Tax=Mesorhizobium sp. ZC-5 TaxID=2986066 RepID=UPI0021E85C70|nr:NAD(P)H-binding protein [Mesorhizobium sp. ZC-5]MCV3243238.1 NAD(P)H-binding protein [Mesorhizobium sp. ZC-5]